MKQNDGYTLIEISVAIVLSGLIATLVWSVYLFGARLFGDWQTRLETRTELHLFIRTIAEDIQEAALISVASDQWVFVGVHGDSTTYRLTDSGLMRNRFSILSEGYIEAELTAQSDCMPVAPQKCFRVAAALHSNADTIRASTVVQTRQYSLWIEPPATSNPEES